MDLQRNSRHSRLSRLSNFLQGSSLRGSAFSLGRNSQRVPSLGRRISLVDAMDLEYPEPSMADTLLEQPLKRFSQRMRVSEKQGEGYDYDPDITEKDLNRKSNYRVRHECLCEKECERHHCNCWLTPNEICVIGQCCPLCIALKNSYLQEHRGWAEKKEAAPLNERKQKIMQLISEKNSRNMHYMKQVFGHQPTMKDLVFCTCKKSNCQKRYCPCYDKGLPCNQFCMCLECHNSHLEEQQEEEEQQRRWERYATYNPDPMVAESAQGHNIDEYLNTEVLQEQFEEQMDFQPPDFSNLHQ